MIGCVSSIFWRGQMPANMTDPVRWKECIVYFSSSWVSMTPGIKVVPDGSKVNWFGEARLQGSDWKAEDPVSVLCKVQSCVTYWHLCLLWVPLGPLLSVEKHTHTRKRKKKKALAVSSSLFSTWVGWIQSWWKYKWDAASTEVSCFLYLLIPFDCSLFFYWVTESHRSWCIHVDFIWAQGTDNHALYLVST